MNQFLIATHSTLAEGLANAIHFFNSDAANIHYINAYVEDNEFEKALRAKLAAMEPGNLVILTDLAGGSVNQIAAKLMREIPFVLVTGVNFPLVLEMVYQSEDITPELAVQIVERARAEMMCMNTLNAEAEDADPVSYTHLLQRIETGLQAMEETGCADDVTVLIARVSKR